MADYLTGWTSSCSTNSAGRTILRCGAPVCGDVVGQHVRAEFILEVLEDRHRRPERSRTIRKTASPTAIAASAIGSRGTKAVEADPNNIIAWNNRGLAFRAKGEFDRAIADHARAIAIAPNDTVSFANRGEAYQARGDFALGACRLHQGDRDRSAKTTRSAATTAFRAPSQTAPQIATPDFGTPPMSEGSRQPRLLLLSEARPPGRVHRRLRCGLEDETWSRERARRSRPRPAQGRRGCGNADIAAAKAVQANIAEERTSPIIAAIVTVGRRRRHGRTRKNAAVRQRR